MAPGFEPGAIEVLSAKKNLRPPELPAGFWRGGTELRLVSGGLLMQTTDSPSSAAAAVEAGGRRGRRRRDARRSGVRLAGMPLGQVERDPAGQGRRIRGRRDGQVNRVDSCRLAVERAGDRAAAASPHRTRSSRSPTAEILIAAGVRAIVQPGGSIRDDDVIAAAAGSRSDHVLHEREALLPLRPRPSSAPRPAASPRASSPISSASPVDVDLAEQQWGEYVSALDGWGFETVGSPATTPARLGVRRGRRGRVRRPRGAHEPGRREPQRPRRMRWATRARAPRRSRWRRIELPGTLDGGDVLKIGRTVYVGPGRPDERRRHPAARALLDPARLHGRRRSGHEGAAPQVGVTALPDGTVVGHPTMSTTRGVRALPADARARRRRGRARRAHGADGGRARRRPRSSRTAGTASSPSTSASSRSSRAA